MNHSSYTWAEVITNGIVPKEHFTINEDQLMLNNSVVNPDWKLILFECENDIIIIIEEDWSSSNNDIMYERILVFDDGQVFETSFPQSNDFVVSIINSGIKIDFQYFYREKIKKSIIYENGIFK